MTSCAPLIMDNVKPLDFTSLKSDPLVLDLSCKKSNSPPLDVSPDIHHDNLSNSSNYYPISYEGQTHLTDIFNKLDGKKSPIERKAFIMTPPSGMEFLKRTKYETDLKETQSLSLNQIIHTTYPPMLLNFPIPVIPANSLTLEVPHNDSNPIQITKTSSTTQELPVKKHDNNNKRTPRPFKAYPKDPLSFTPLPELMYDQNSSKAYSAFRKKMLDSVRRNTDETNAKMRRVSKSPILPTSTFDEKDAAYWERRRKNNEAAKRSRDARRAKEDEIAIRAAFLEQENVKLKIENEQLRCALISKYSNHNIF